MATTSRPSDPAVESILKALEELKENKPAVSVDAVRANLASIRIRVVDPAFAAVDRAERDERIWELLSRISPDFRSEVSVLLLLSPEEQSESIGNREFERLRRNRRRSTSKSSDKGFPKGLYAQPGDKAKIRNAKP